MMENIVSNIITTTFENEVKRWQTKNEKQMAMLISFSLSLDYDKEEGVSSSRHPHLWADELCWRPCKRTLDNNSH